MCMAILFIKSGFKLPSSFPSLNPTFYLVSGISEPNFMKKRALDYIHFFQIIPKINYFEQDFQMDFQWGFLNVFYEQNIINL